MSVLVLSTTDQHDLYAALLAATRERRSRPDAAAADEGRAVAVLDPTWPEAMRSAAVSAVDAAAAEERITPGDLVLFTSGSTHRPRGVVRTVASWRASLAALTSVTGLRADDSAWLPGPLWSSLFLYGAWHAGLLGARVLLSEDDPASATAVHCVPSQLPGLLNRAARGRLPSIRLAVVGGDRLPTGLRERAAAQGWRVVEYYGAAELSFVGIRDDDGPFRPFPGVEIDLRAGTLWARSAYLARGYLEASAGDSMRRDEAGWATVGDRAEGDGSGFHVLGRGDTGVTTGGHTVVVEDVEQALRALPGVTDAAVLGLPHPRLGQQLVAVVVGDLALPALRAAVATLPAAARPRRWLRADRLPRTPAGKLVRAELMDLAQTLHRS